MKSALSAMHRFSSNPWTQVFVAVILLATAFGDFDGTLIEVFTSGDWGAHHGVFVLGFAQLLKSLPELVDGIERLQHRGDESGGEGGEAPAEG